MFTVVLSIPNNCEHPKETVYVTGVCCCWNECLQSYSSTYKAIGNLLSYLQQYTNLNNFYFHLSGPCVIDTRGTNCKVLPTYLQNR